MADVIINEITIIPVSAIYPHELGRNSRNMEIGRSVLEWVIRANTSGGTTGFTIAQQFMSPRNGGTVSELVSLLRETFLGQKVGDLLLFEGDVVVGPGKKFKAVLILFFKITNSINWWGISINCYNLAMLRAR